MSQYRCESCDIPLTVEQLRIEVGTCPKCRAELDAGYKAQRAYWVARLLFVLRFARHSFESRRMAAMLLEAIDLSPKCPWPSPTSGREVELTRERGEQ